MPEAIGWGKSWIIVGVVTAAALAAGGMEEPTSGPSDRGESGNASDRYEAVALLRVNLPGNNPISSRREAIGNEEMVRLINGHVRCLLREEVLRAALTKQAVTTSRWYLQRDKTSVMEELKKSLTVAPVKDTYLIEVRMAGHAVNFEERAGLANIVTAVARTYVEICGEEAGALIRGQIRLLQTEMERLNRTPADAAEADFVRATRHKVMGALLELTLRERGEEHDIRLAGTAEVPMAPTVPAAPSVPSVRSVPSVPTPSTPEGCVPSGALVGALVGLLAGLLIGLALRSGRRQSAVRGPTPPTSEPPK